MEALVVVVVGDSVGNVARCGTLLTSLLLTLSFVDIIQRRNRFYLVPDLVIVIVIT